MSCSLIPTATEYATVTTFFPSTSYSQGAVASPQVTTFAQQACIASGTINGSSVGCISSTQSVQVNTVGGGGQGAQVPVVVSVPVVGTQPTQTLFAPCSSGGGDPSTPQPIAQTSIDIQLTTSVLVQSTFPPTAVVEASSTTLADGSVVQTVVTMLTTLPPTSVYLATSLVEPTTTPLLQSNNDTSQGSGTNVAPIIGGVLGGFLGLVAIVGFLWWLCRRRRSWDDIYNKEELRDNDAWQPPTRERDSRKLGLNAEPTPYQYGLVGHVVPPAAAGEPVRSSHYSSVSDYSGTHSRQTSLSATPLLHATRSSRPSTAGSAQTIQTLPETRVLSSVAAAERAPRSLSLISHSNNPGPLLGGPAMPGARTSNTDDLVVLEVPERTGSPVSSTERRILQIVNDGPPSPAETVSPPSAGRVSSVRSSNVFVHTDGGPVLESDSPPAYRR